MLMLPMKYRQEQLSDDDVGPIIRVQEQDDQPGWSYISEQSRELKILWAQWDLLPLTKKVCIIL